MSAIFTEKKYVKEKNQQMHINYNVQDHKNEHRNVQTCNCNHVDMKS